MVIRCFCNADLPKLLDVWDQHWSATGPPPMVTMAKFEQALVARTFFRPDRLLVAENDRGDIVGWISMADREDANQLLVCALCFLPSSTEAGRQLLQAAEQLGSQLGRAELRVGLVRDQWNGLTALDPIGHGFGIPANDFATAELMRADGFQPTSRTVQMIVSTTEYRPPISREMMQLRRSARIASRAYVFSDRRQAVAMSHFDVESSELLSAAGEQIATIRVWYSDPEAEVMEPNMAIIELADALDRGNLTAAESYLIATSIQAMERRRVMAAETAIDADRSELISQLESLKFQRAGQGELWTKRMA